MNLPPTFHPSRLSQNTGLNSLSHIANSHWLFTLRVAGYMFPCYFFQLSHPLLPLPTMSTSLFSVSVSPLLPCKYIHQYHISIFHVVTVAVQLLSNV